jgi:amino acid permease
MIITMAFGNKPISERTYISLSIAIICVPLLFALFYPHVGDILSYVGAIAGFLIVYLLPVLTYLKVVRTQYENPILAKAI